MRHRFVVTAAVAVMVASLAVNVGTEQAADNPAFEAASIKPNKTGDGRISLFFQPGGRFMATGVTLRMLVGAAYGEAQPLPDFRLIGGPNWIGSDRFDIIAKAEGDPQPGPQGPPPVMFMMLRTLLKERFQLAVHNESRELAIYALVTARGDKKLGAQMNPATVDCAALRGARGNGPPSPPPLTFTGRPPCGIRIAPGNMAGGSVSMTQLTTVFSRLVSRTVVDRTGISGNFDVDLQWTPDVTPQGPGTGLPPGAPPLPPIDPNGPSIFTAVQEQLGLKLESTKGPVDVVVIDRAEQPTED